MDINDEDELFPIDLNLYPSDTQPPSSSGPLLFGHLLLPPPPPPLSTSSPLILHDTPWSFPFPSLYDYELPPLLSPSAPSSGPFLFSPPVPPTPLLLPAYTPSSGSFIFSPPLPLPLPWEQLFPLPWGQNEGEEWHSNQASQRQQETRLNAEEESWSSSQVVPSSLGQSSTLTEKQIWEVLDKLKNQVYTGETCVICLEYFVPKEEVSVTPCNHMFHKKCLVPWVMQKGQCPHCRFLLFEATTNPSTGSSSSISPLTFC